MPSTYSASLLRSLCHGNHFRYQDPVSTDELVKRMYGREAIHVLVQRLQYWELFELHSNVLPVEFSRTLLFVGSDAADKVRPSRAEMGQNLGWYAHLTGEREDPQQINVQQTDSQDTVQLAVKILYSWWSIYCTVGGQDTVQLVVKILYSWCSSYCTVGVQDTVQLVFKLLYSWWSRYCTVGGQDTVLLVVNILYSWWSRYCTVGGQYTVQSTDRVSYYSTYVLQRMVVHIHVVEQCGTMTLAFHITWKSCMNVVDSFITSGVVPLVSMLGGVIRHICPWAVPATNSLLSSWENKWVAKPNLQSYGEINHQMEECEHRMKTGNHRMNTCIHQKTCRYLSHWHM